MSKPKSGLSPFLNQCFVTAAVCINIVGHGCSVGYPAVLLPQLLAPGALVPITKDEASWLTSSISVPMLIGNFMTPPIMDRLGRRAAHFAAILPSLVGSFGVVLAGDFKMLLGSRILQALSFGMLLPLRSVLIGEYTSPKNRGAFLTTVSLAQAFGIFFVHLVGSLLSWQQTALVCIFFPFTSLLMTIYCPESPSFLAARGKYEECRKVHRWLRGTEEDEECEEMIRARIDYEKMEIRDNLNLWEVIKKKEFYKPIVLMTHAQAMMQFAGGSTMATYSTVILGLILGSGANLHFWMIALDGQRIVSNAAAIYVINRCKRRTMMFSTGALCVLSHIAIAAYVYLKDNGILKYDALWLPVLLVNLHFFSVATGMVPMPNVIGGEVFPLQYRSIGSSIGVVAAALLTFIVLKTFPALLDSIGLHGTYLLYAGVLTYFLTVIWFLLPETKGRTLQQIEDEFRGRPLKPEELEVRQSLQMNVARKMSMMSTHSMAIEI